MLLNKESEHLHDERFEGSTNEHHIFTEVFFGKDQSKTSKKCLVTGAINFEPERSKQTDALFSPKSENSTILDSSIVKSLKDNSEPGCFSNVHALLKRNENVVNGKRKLSLDEQPAFHSVTCHLVETFNESVTSSCYLIKGDVSKRRLRSFNENDEKEIYASKVTPSTVFLENSDKKSQSIGSCVKLSGDKALSHRNITKDPRPLLRRHVQNLLRASGWEITQRKKADKDVGYIYISPQTGKTIRELRRAWNLCGQSLPINKNVIMLEDGKEWNDITSFCSDLSITLIRIDEEFHNIKISSSLAQQWCLLDPFVNLVFFEKKLGMLKLGELVKVRSSFLIDSHVKEDAIISSNNIDRIGNRSLRGSPHGFGESSLVGGSVLTNTEANNCISNDSCGTRITVDFGQLNRGAVKALNGVPVNISGENFTLSGMPNEFSPNCNTDGNSDHSSSCLYEAITTQNGLTSVRETVSPSEEGNVSSPATRRLMSYHKEETMSEINKSVQIGSSRGGFRSCTMNPDLSMQEICSETPQALKGNVENRSVASRINDDDLLISAFIKKKTSKSTGKKTNHKLKPSKSKPLKKNKTQKGGCRLLPRSLGKGGKHMQGKRSVFGSRTVLSWLINSGVVSINEVIQYQDPKDNAVIKEGLVTREGVLCTCCNKVISVSEFKFHAGFRLNGPCLDLVMGSGNPFSLRLLEAWSNEYRIRKSATRTIEVEDLDQNDDSCGLCGDGGELICCDNCPSTFHLTCLYEQELPEGNWYCQFCSCHVCGDLVDDKSTGALKCSQCDHKYHEACLKKESAHQEARSETWFCAENCQEVYLGLQSHIGILNFLSDGFAWTLLRCIHVDQRVHSAQKIIALRAECNSKLAVALTIMEECFLPMVDARTGIDMIPHVLYSWGSEFARLNYHGFYTMVLEKDDVLISAASIRIHGVRVAEMPLIATCSKYRRQGMCRRLMNSIEEMLKSFKVEELVISAIPDLVETWTVGFGFEPLEKQEKKSLSDINLMVFPGTVWLKKTIYKDQAIDEQTSSSHALPFCKENQAEMGLCSDGLLVVDLARPLGVSTSLGEVVTQIEAENEPENGHECGSTQVEVDKGLCKDFSQMSCENTAITEFQSRLELLHQVQSVAVHDEIDHSKVPWEEQPTIELGECQLKVPSHVEFVSVCDVREFSNVPLGEEPKSELGQRDLKIASDIYISIAKMPPEEQPTSEQGESQLKASSHVDSVAVLNTREHPVTSSENRPAPKLEEQLEVASAVDSLVMYEERELCSDQHLRKANIVQETTDQNGMFGEGVH